MEFAGLAIGVAGIAIAFKGVVDTVNLFDQIFEDNGSRALALKYQIERQRLHLWGDDFKVRDEKSPLRHEPAMTRRLIAGILAEIRANHGLAARYVKHHETEIPDEDAVTESDALQIESQLIKNTQKRRKEQKQRRRFRWATKDREKFQTLVLLLLTIGQDIEIEPQPHPYEFSTAYLLSLDQDKKQQRGERVWIETRSLDHPSNAKLEANLRDRIITLSVVLSIARSPEFCIPLCLGLSRLEDGLSVDLGIVYGWPAGTDSDRAPKSLRQLLTEIDMPLLEDRYIIALKLATAISLFHATTWLHRAFRGDKILFFEDTEGQLLIYQPYITGFEYARPTGGVSADARRTGDPSLDMYYHPEVPALGFNALREVYGLGVVLFEIAFWQPLSGIITASLGKQPGEMSLPEVKQFLLSSGSALGGQVGAAYRDAVMACVRSEFGKNVEEEAGGPNFARAFFINVIRVCKVQEEVRN
ncbi:hypothetical protein LTS15_009475 [Exophiala xenobiotica]|nr:hypothetical protein LTS15_009475 [Exophiala xenobiotica]